MATQGQCSTCQRLDEVSHGGLCLWCELEAGTGEVYTKNMPTNLQGDPGFACDEIEVDPESFSTPSQRSLARQMITASQGRNQIVKFCKVCEESPVVGPRPILGSAIAATSDICDMCLGVCDQPGLKAKPCTLESCTQCGCTLTEESGRADGRCVSCHEIITGLHPSVSHLLKYFGHDHLPPHLALISKPFCDLAHKVAVSTSGPETSACLRKLLEAKDCAVRAAL